MLRIDLCLTNWSAVSSSLAQLQPCMPTFCGLFHCIRGGFCKDRGDVHGDSLNPVDGIHPMDAGKVSAATHGRKHGAVEW
jgi:hypothetical protein